MAFCLLACVWCGMEVGVDWGKGLLTSSKQRGSFESEKEEVRVQSLTFGCKCEKQEAEEEEDSIPDRVGYCEYERKGRRSLTKRRSCVMV